MAKIGEWLMYGSVLFSTWLSIVTGTVESALFTFLRPFILYLPLIIFCVVCLYMAGVVLYRVFTFNTCEDAARELQQEIQEAKTDLQNKGIELKN